jgi:hypothetical protein
MYLGVQNSLQPGGEVFAIQGDESKSLIVGFIPRHFPECSQGKRIDPTIDGKLLHRFHQFPSDTAPLLTALDCHLPDVQGVWHHLPVQESRNSITLQFRDESNAICDQGAMLFLRLNIIVGNPFQPRPLPEYLPGTAFDLGQKGDVTVACESDAYHVRTLAEGSDREELKSDIPSDKCRCPQ